VHALQKKEATSNRHLKNYCYPGGSTATATVGPAKKEGIKKFSDLVGKTKADTGLFNTYKIDGKYYFEIPDSLTKPRNAGSYPFC
jgi:hypothetical protein